MARPGPHSEPPADLSTRELPILHLSADWYRLHRCLHAPLYFGRTGQNRFDAPAGEYGVLYLAREAHGAFIETFGDLTLRTLTTEEVALRCLSRVAVDRSLALVDLTGSGLARLGADERLCAGDHALAQRWALALWAHPAQPDGLYYRARHDPSRLSAAIYDRAAGAVHATSMGSLTAPGNLPLLADMLEAYGIGLIGPA